MQRSDSPSYIQKVWRYIRRLPLRNPTYRELLLSSTSWTNSCLSPGVHTSLFSKHFIMNFTRAPISISLWETPSLLHNIQLWPKSLRCVIRLDRYLYKYENFFILIIFLPYIKNVTVHPIHKQYGHYVDKYSYVYVIMSNMNHTLSTSTLVKVYFIL